MGLDQKRMKALEQFDLLRNPALCHEGTATLDGEGRQTGPCQ